MSSQVVKCWNCPRQFEVTLDSKPTSVHVYKGLNPQSRAESGRKQGKEIVRNCPFCKEQNMIVVPQEG